MYKQDLTLIEQLKDQTNTLDPKEEIFQVHVGDIQNPKKTQCASSHFNKIAGYFKTYSKLPNLILPGDNGEYLYRGGKRVGAMTLYDKVFASHTIRPVLDSYLLFDRLERLPQS